MKPYYQQHFEALCEFVFDKHHWLLSEFEQSLWYDYQRLSQPAKCLLIRLLGRSGNLFRLDKLNYPECDIPACAQELSTLDYIQLKEEIPQALATKLLLKAELAKAYQLPSSLKKDELLTQAIPEQYQAPSLPYLSLGCEHAWQVYQLLFFGNHHQKLNEFIKQELGHLRFEPVLISAKRYQNREELEWHLVLHSFESLIEDTHELEELLTLAQTLNNQSSRSWLKQKQQKLSLAIAKKIERLDVPAAIALYEIITLPPARERRCQLHLRLKQKERAFEISQQILQAPICESERQFAQKFQRHFDKGFALFEPETFTIEIAKHEQGVEAAAARYFSQSTQQAFVVENSLINTLFALVYWQALYAPLEQAFSHPFQFQAHDLTAINATQSRKPWRLLSESWLKGSNYKHWIKQRFDEKFGISNPFCHWQLINWPLLEQALDAIPVSHLLALFDRIWFDIKYNRAGLPDLILFTKTGYELIEIKGPGDTLQHNQRAWFEYFAQHNIPARVCHVRYL